MLFGVPTDVKRFLAPITQQVSKSIGKALPTMILAFLLAPHRRCLKTVAGMVLGHRVHVATISRRLVNPHWNTGQWHRSLYEEFWQDVDHWDRSQTMWT